MLFRGVGVEPQALEVGLVNPDLPSDLNKRDDRKFEVRRGFSVHQ